MLHYKICIKTTSGLSILLHGVISLPDVTSYENLKLITSENQTLGNDTRLHQSVGWDFKPLPHLLMTLAFGGTLKNKTKKHRD